MLIIFFLALCLFNASTSFSMDESQKIATDNQKKIITVNLNDRCSLCWDSLSVKKGAIALPYCGHPCHGLCLAIQLNSKINTCFCGAALKEYDEEGNECLKKYNKEKYIIALRRIFSSSAYYSAYYKDIAIYSIKHVYNTAHIMYSTAGNYDEDGEWTI